MITKAGSALALLLLFQASGLGQDRPGIPEVKKIGPGLVTLIAASNEQDGTPSVEIKGPTSRPAGRTAVLKISASGKDLKVACFPANEEWFLVQFVGKTEVGILFETDKAGVYSFAVGVNDGGKTAVAVHVITIGTPPSPDPIPVPVPKPVDKLLKAIQDSYSRDVVAGRGDKVMREKLRDAYLQGAKTFIDGAKTNIELMTNQGQLNTGIIGAASVALPQVRLEIGAAVTEVLGSNPQGALDAAKAKDLWAKIAQALDKATP